MEQTKYLSILVENHAGVLARVALLFCQRGFNIDSLTVSATDNPEVSRITITTHGDDAAFRQILLQSKKLYETKAIIGLDSSSKPLLRELLLIKVHADKTNRRELYDIAEIYKAKTIDMSRNSIVFELTGEPETIDGLLDVLRPYTIIEMCRTGVTAMERGDVTYK